MPTSGIDQSNDWTTTIKMRWTYKPIVTPSGLKEKSELKYEKVNF